MLGMPNRVAADTVKSESPPTMGAMLRRILMLERVIKATEGKLYVGEALECRTGWSFKPAQTLTA